MGGYGFFDEPPGRRELRRNFFRRGAEGVRFTEKSSVEVRRKENFCSGVRGIKKFENHCHLRPYIQPATTRWQPRGNVYTTESGWRTQAHLPASFESGVYGDGEPTAARRKRVCPDKCPQTRISIAMLGKCSGGRSTFMTIAMLAICEVRYLPSS